MARKRRFLSRPRPGSPGHWQAELQNLTLALDGHIAMRNAHIQRVLHPPKKAKEAASKKLTARGVWWDRTKHAWKTGWEKLYPSNWFHYALFPFAITETAMQIRQELANNKWDRKTFELHSNVVKNMEVELTDNTTVRGYNEALKASFALLTKSTTNLKAQCSALWSMGRHEEAVKVFANGFKTIQESDEENIRRINTAYLRKFGELSAHGSKGHKSGHTGHAPSGGKGNPFAEFKTGIKPFRKTHGH